MSFSSEHHPRAPLRETMCPISLLLRCMSDGHYLVASGSGHTVPSQATQGTTEKSCCIDPMQKHCNGPIPLTRTLGTQHSPTEMVGKHTVSSNKLLSPKENGQTASHGLLSSMDLGDGNITGSLLQSPALRSFWILPVWWQPDLTHSPRVFLLMVRKGSLRNHMLPWTVLPLT